MADASPPTPPQPTTQEVVQALAPIRMPADFAAFDWRDGLGAFSLGLVLALLCALLLRPFLRKRDDPVAAVRKDLSALAGRPYQERLLGQATWMVRLEVSPPLDPPYREALYRPVRADWPDLNPLDDRILAAATKGLANGEHR